MSNESAQSLPILTVKLLGRLDIRVGRQTITGLPQRRAQELFAYLLLHRNRPYLREALATRLWESIDPAQARKYLRQAIWQLQTLLQSAVGAEAKDLLTLDAEWIQLNSVACLALDVAQFEHAIDASQGTSGDHLSEAQRADLEHAVELYRGDLLEGWYQDWCLVERERLQNCYLAALDKLLVWCDAHGCVDCGLAHAERILRCDDTEEQAHRHIMQLHWMAGHRSKAMRQYQRCTRILLQELGIEPSARTRRLYDQIRADSGHSPSAPEAAPGSMAPPPACANAAELMSDLRQLQARLAHLDTQITGCLHALTTALQDHR